MFGIGGFHEYVHPHNAQLGVIDLTTTIMKGTTTRQKVARGGSVMSERERGMHVEKTIRRRAPCRAVFSTTFLYLAVFFRGMIFFVGI